jgi:class 3 adenylate cyclase/pimeloyl-ACP methyl ester carboxylesterase
MDLQIRFCTTVDGRRIAYSVLGEGSPLVFPAWWVNHLQVLWEHPTARAFFQGLARHHRLILYDRQGCGLSDRSWTDYSLDSDLLVLETVVDHLKIRRLALFGFSHGAPAAIAYAAKYPRRVSHLILFGMLVRPLLEGETGEAVAGLLRAHWGLGSKTIADMCLPGADLPTLEWFARWQRESATPEVAVQVATTDLDPGEFVSRVRAPTLVMHRQEDTMMPFHQGRDLAARIPSARFVPLEGKMHPVFLGEIDMVLRVVAEFLGDPLEPAVELPAEQVVAEDPGRGRMLATVLFTDIVGSTERAAELGDRRWGELLGAHHAAVRRELARFGGREVDTAGDGFLATFDGPARAIRCACAVGDAVRPLGIEVRAGLHTGECELIGEKVGGIAVHIGARVAARAGPGEVLVSSTVKDLVSGSDIRFEDRGTHALKGIPGEWRLFAVNQADRPTAPLSA